MYMCNDNDKQQIAMWCKAITNNKQPTIKSAPHAMFESAEKEVNKQVKNPNRKLKILNKKV